jgi:hypothetical protein
VTCRLAAAVKEGQSEHSIVQSVRGRARLGYAGVLGVLSTAPWRRDLAVPCW